MGVLVNCKILILDKCVNQQITVKIGPKVAVTHTQPHKKKKAIYRHNNHEFRQLVTVHNSTLLVTKTEQTYMRNRAKRGIKRGEPQSDMKGYRLN